MKKNMCPPHLLSTLLLNALSFFFVCMAVPNTKLPESEVAALRAIARQMNYGKWDFTVDPCGGAPGWSEYRSKNVNRTLSCTCDPQICHVSGIVLRGQNLTGVLPKQFAYLVNLTDLDLTRNYLNGSIPREWGSLPLNNLALVGNRISGTIPDELGNMTSLQNLALNDNQLSGQIPEALGKLSNLNLLTLSGNYLTGELPESLGNLKNLTDFEIQGNPITGKIPTFIGNWTQLQHLDLQGTYLEGSFPPIFANLSNIKGLKVSDLAGNGMFPPLQNMTNMKYLTLRNLSISGQLPPYIGGLPIKTLDLSFNNLSGSIPDIFENLQDSLNFMLLSNNILTGPIPKWILSNNKAFDLSNNNFTGRVPSNCQKELVNLASSHSPNDSSELNACFHRDLPCLGKRKNNYLFINCGGNKSAINNTVYEEDLDDHGESTYSASSDNKWAFSSMGVFLDGGNRQDYIVTNTSVLTMNNLQLYTTARRTAVSLRYYGFCLQKGNYTVMLHFAEITFINDETYFSVGRRIFDVIIQGKKVLQDFDIAKEANGTGKEIIKNFTTFVDGTLDIHLYWAGKGTSGVPQLGTFGPIISAISVKPNFTPDTGKLSVGAILGIIAGSLVVFFILLALLWFCIRRKISEYNDLKSLKLQTGYFTLKQIKAATRNFNLANKIGEGGFGPVYKGVMPDRTEIAVKQLSSKSKQGNREFVNEIGMMSGLQHPNLVKLFGCCVEGNQLLVIYEYMENNSLARALFGPEKSRLKLDWQTRLKICLDIARGLAYLHEESRLKIVHRDIKATNILLDKDLNARISDFGLAKLNEEENTHISTRIAGTVGYMAPEYATRGYLTDKADVYSYGIVILEIISGVSNTKFKSEKDSPMKKQFTYLLDWVYVLQEQGRLLELVDPSLGSDYSKEEALQMLNLALICTSPSPSLRPTMSTVVSMLDGKTLIQAPTTKGAVLESMDMRFKAFEIASHGSQLQRITADGPFTGSLVSGQSIRRETLDLPTEKILSDDSGVCTEVFSGR